jgi:hypothetical protein
VLRSVYDTLGRLNIQMIGRSHATVPITRVLNRAFLITVIHIDQAIALGVAVGPLKIVQQAPGVK